MITKICTCPNCHRKHTVKVPFEGFNKWLLIEAAQNSVGDLSTLTFESLTAEMCADCKKQLYRVESQEVDDDAAGYDPSTFQDDYFHRYR